MEKDPSVRLSGLTRVRQVFDANEGNPEAQADAISRLLTDDDPSVRKAAAFALGRDFPRGEGGKHAREVMELLSDPLRLVAESSAHGLELMGSTGANALAEGLKQKSPQARALAATSLGRMGEIGGRHAEKLGDRLRFDDDSEVRSAAAFALEKLGPVAVETLLKAKSFGFEEPLAGILSSPDGAGYVSSKLANHALANLRMGLPNLHR